MKSKRTGCIIGGTGSKLKIPIMVIGSNEEQYLVMFANGNTLWVRKDLVI